MNNTRRSFIKRLLLLLTAITAPLTLKAKDKKPKATQRRSGTRYKGGPQAGWWIDGQPCTPEQWWDIDNYPHTYERVHITKTYDCSRRARVKYRGLNYDFMEIS